MQNLFRIVCISIGILSGVASVNAQTNEDDIVAGRISQNPTVTCISEAAEYRNKLETCAKLSRERTYTPPRSTHAMVNSLRSETEIWHQLMDSASSELVNLYTTEQRRSATGENLSDLLIQSQKKWLDWKDAQCSFEHAIVGHGSMRLTKVAGCKHKITAARAIELAELRYYETRQ